MPRYLISLYFYAATSPQIEDTKFGTLLNRNLRPIAINAPLSSLMVIILQSDSFSFLILHSFSVRAAPSNRPQDIPLPHINSSIQPWCR
jgi:hypothetical protein